MCKAECKDRLRVRMSDASGDLRFEAFEIVNSPACREIEATLRDYLVGRSLEDVDLGYLRGLTCPEDGEPALAVLQEVEKCKRLFGR